MLPLDCGTFLLLHCHPNTCAWPHMSSGLHQSNQTQMLLTPLRWSAACLCANISSKPACLLPAELVPIYASAPLHDSGVGLQSSQLALPLSLSGLVLMAWAVFVYPLCQQRFGTVSSVRAGLLAGCPLIMSIPVATLVGGNKLAAQLYLCLSLSLKNVAATHAFTSSMILVNHAGRHALGPVNGAGQMLASFVRAIGPALAGVIWGFSLHLSLPGSQFVPFATAAIVALLNQFIYLLVSPSLANI